MRRRRIILLPVYFILLLTSFSLPDSPLLQLS
jgi:hypothetical protein